MYQELTISFQKHLAQNHPELLIQLQEEGRLTDWLTEKVDTVRPLVKQLRSIHEPDYLIHERCMHELVSQLPLSRFNYVVAVLEEEFEADYFRYAEMGVLTYEVLNMLEVCAGVFDTMGFTAETEDNRDLYYAITGTVKEYLDSAMREKKM